MRRSTRCSRQLVDMPLNIGIDGFGRIGRMGLPGHVVGTEIKGVGFFKHDVKVTGADTFEVYDNTVKCVMANREGPKAVPWKDLGVDFVIESTGWFVEADEAQGHIDAGAKKVIIFAPGKGALKTLVMGWSITQAA